MHCAPVSAALAAALAQLAAGQSVTAPFEAQALPGLAGGDNLGRSVAALGDVNGDGVADVGAGAIFADIGASATGAAFVWFGAPDGSFANPPDLTLAGLAPDDHAGISLAGLDLNGDGVNDIAVGVRFSDLFDTDAGAVFVYLGGGGIDAAREHTLLGEATDDWFGQSVARAGDVNGDGFEDLIVGAPFNDAPGNAAGRAYVYFGGDPFDGAPDVILEGAGQNNAHFGWSVGGGVDVNGDGFDDVIVGERLFSSGPFRAVGRAYVFFGGDPMDTTADVVLQGAAPDDWLGESVAGAGDVNGDGFGDVVVGAIFSDANGSASGAGMVFFGGDPMDTVADVTLPGPHGDAQAGNAVGGAGDVDGDGFADVIVGAHFADDGAAHAAGKAFVLFGGSPMDGAPDGTVTGGSANAQLGESVGGGGSLALVGAHFSDAGGPDSGLALVIGAERACAGDLNNDGVVDGADLGLLLGAWGGAGDADLNADGAVDGADLGLLLGAWGAC